MMGRMEDVLSAARRALEGVLPEGWTLDAEPTDRDFVVRLRASEPGGSDEGAWSVLWAQPRGRAFRAYVEGPRYAAAYRAGEDSELAKAACERLVSLEVGPPIGEPASAGDEALTIEAVMERLEPWLGLGGELIDGWMLEAVEEPGAGEVHLVFAQPSVPWLARIVVTPEGVRHLGRAGKYRPAGIALYQRLLAETLETLLGARGGAGFEAPDGLRPASMAATKLPGWFFGRGERAEALAAEVVRRFQDDVGALVDMDGLHRALAEAFPDQPWGRWVLLLLLQEGLHAEPLDAPGEPLSDEAAAAVLRVLVSRFGAHPDLAAWALAVLAEGLDRPRSAPVIAAARSELTTVPARGRLSVSSERRVEDATALSWIRVAPQTFTMGRAQPLIHAESRLGSVLSTHGKHAVTLTRVYELADVPVTQALWREVMGGLPADLTFRHPEHPVEGVSWLEAAAFCNAVSDELGLAPAYEIEGGEVRWPDPDAPGVRLPTEAEWELACRLGEPKRVHYDATATSSVWARPADELGWRDLRGNVHELVWDRPAPGRTAEARDPRGAGSGRLVMACGGAWTSWRARLCEPSARILLSVAGRGYDVGFRLARTVPG